jgi:beta-N-acetylhexosaminidase
VDRLLPLRPAAAEQIGVITVRPADLTPADTSSFVQVRLPQTIAQRHANVLHIEIPHAPDADEIRAAVERLQHVSTVIAGTISADHYPQQGALLDALRQQGKAVIAVAMRTPYDLIAYPAVSTYLCAYGIRDATTEAIARVLFGEIEPSGVLPCRIPDMAS